MQSEHRVVRVSGIRPAIHSYFDICPESPDGKRLVYFQWDSAVPGPGEVVVADLDGTSPRSVGRSALGAAHVGVHQTWIDADTVAFSRPAGSGVETVLVTVSTGATRVWEGALRHYSPANGLALYASHDTRVHGARTDEAAVYALDLRSGRRRRLFTAEEAMAVHPMRDRVPPRDMNFKHTKWAPDGKRFFCVFDNLAVAKSDPAYPRPQVKSLLIANADGSNLRYFREAGGHPMWTPDGTSIFSYYRLEDGANASVAYPPDGGPLAVLHRGPGANCTLRPDGRLCLTDSPKLHPAGPTRILLYRLGGSEPRVLAAFRSNDLSHATGCHPHPVWSRDGRRAYFNCDESGHAELYAVDLPPSA